jgi:hypothetical protein
MYIWLKNSPTRLKPNTKKEFPLVKKLPQARNMVA